MSLRVFALKEIKFNLCLRLDIVNKEEAVCHKEICNKIPVSMTFATGLNSINGISKLLNFCNLFK